jgi:16S rRNA (cytidine1402-2'-O)-methyltransferase
MQRQSTNHSDNHKLYLVGVPIGNYEDITFRALSTLQTVDIIFCEDTRVTGQLLNHFNIKTPLKSYHAFNENEITDKLIERVKQGEKVAVVSDAGMPAISDPGFMAARSAINENIDVVVIPGVTAGVTALVGSGIPTQPYLFYGFLNSNSNKKKDELKTLRDREETLIIYEAIHRLQDTLELILETLGDRYIVLARELTKKYEEYIRGNVSEIIPIVSELKGEFVIVIEGAKESKLVEELNSLTIKEHYDYYLGISEDRKEAMKKVAKDRGISKSIVYQEVLGKNKDI